MSNRSIFLASAFARIAFAKPHEGTGTHHDNAPQADAPQVETPPTPAPASPVASVVVTIAGIDVSLPIKFAAGHTLSDAEAKVLDAAFRRQYANNQNAGHKAWEEKVKKAGTDAAALKTAGDNPATADKLVANYVTYVPNVGASQESQLEKTRKEAGLRRLAEMMDEHNAIVAAGGRGFFGDKPASMPKGKGSADARDAIVAKILASTKQAEHVQRHIDAILKEKGAATETKPDAVALTAELDF